MMQWGLYHPHHFRAIRTKKKSLCYYVPKYWRDNVNCGNDLLTRCMFGDNCGAEAEDAKTTPLVFEHIRKRDEGQFDCYAKVVPNFHIHERESGVVRKCFTAECDKISHAHLTHHNAWIWQPFYKLPTPPSTPSSPPAGAAPTSPSFLDAERWSQAATATLGGAQASDWFEPHPTSITTFENVIIHLSNLEDLIVKGDEHDSDDPSLLVAPAAGNVAALVGSPGLPSSSSTPAPRQLRSSRRE
jgi:hypothetical protein